MPISNPIEHFSDGVNLPTTMPSSIESKDTTSITSNQVHILPNQKLRGRFAEEGGALALQRTGNGTFRIDLHWEITDSATSSKKVETLEIKLKNPTSDIKQQYLSALLVAKAYRQGVIQAHKSQSRDIDFKVDFLRATLLSGTKAPPTGKELVETKVLSRGELRHAEHQAEKAYSQFRSQISLKGTELPPLSPQESRIQDSQLDHAKTLLHEAKDKLAEIKVEMATTKQGVMFYIPRVVESPQHIERLERLLEAALENPTPRLLIEIKECRKEVEKEVHTIEKFLSGKKEEPSNAAATLSEQVTAPTQPTDPKAQVIEESIALLKEASVALKKFYAVRKRESDQESPLFQHDSAKCVTTNVNQPNLFQMEKTISRAKINDTIWDDPFKVLKDRYNPQARELIEVVNSEAFQAVYQRLSLEERREIES